MTDFKKQMADSKQEYMSAKKEENMFKFMDLGENRQKLKRGQSAYKRHLVDKIIEKGARGKDISVRRERVSEMAVKNSQQIRH